MDAAKRDHGLIQDSRRFDSAAIRLLAWGKRSLRANVIRLLLNSERLASAAGARPQ